MSTENAKQRFDAEVWPHAATVLRVASYLADDDAEDLAQETLLKAYRALGQLRRDSDPKKWLLAILRNTAADRSRTSRRRPLMVPLDDAIEFTSTAPATAAGPNDDPDQMLEAFSDQQVINALRNLPDEIRWTLMLVDVEGLDQTEAASVLAVPLGTVKSRLHRGRGMLRASLAAGTGSIVRK